MAKGRPDPGYHALAYYLWNYDTARYPGGGITGGGYEGEYTVEDCTYCVLGED